MKQKKLVFVITLVLIAALCAGLLLTRKPKPLGFSWKPFEKACFVFVLDDTNDYTGPMYRLFHEKGVPLSIAAIPEMLDTPAVGMDGTIETVLHAVEQDGGEILAHYSGNLADPGYRDGEHSFETDQNAWLGKTAWAMQRLQERGLTVHGIIRADYSQEGSRTGEEICRKYFAYSDGLGYSPQYHLTRTFMMSYDSTEAFLAWIDACCQTPGFYPICFHGWESIADIESVSLMLDRILACPQAEITTYRDVMERYAVTGE